MKIGDEPPQEGPPACCPAAPCPVAYRVGTTTAEKPRIKDRIRYMPALRRYVQ
jgi:hypothetical protein